MPLNCNQCGNDYLRGSSSRRKLGSPTSRTTSFELSIRMDGSGMMWSREGPWAKD